MERISYYPSLKPTCDDLSVPRQDFLENLREHF